MRTLITPSSVKLWASAHDTREWANRPSARWPCSYLSGSRFFAEFDSNGLLEFTVDGRMDNADNIPADELNAITADLLRSRLPREHPAYFAAVGQFECAQGTK